MTRPPSRLHDTKRIAASASPSAKAAATPMSDRLLRMARVRPRRPMGPRPESTPRPSSIEFHCCDAFHRPDLWKAAGLFGHATRRPSHGAAWLSPARITPGRVKAAWFAGRSADGDADGARSIAGAAPVPRRCVANRRNRAGGGNARAVQLRAHPACANEHWRAVIDEPRAMHPCSRRPVRCYEPLRCSGARREGSCWFSLSPSSSLVPPGAP